MGAFFPKPRPERHGRGSDEDNGTGGGTDRGTSSGDQEDNKGKSGGGSEETESWIKDLTNRELCYFHAGIIGINPRLLTLRKLTLMSNGKERSDWNKFSVLTAKIHNVNCTKKSEMIDFRDIHPCYVIDELHQRSRGPSNEEVSKGWETLRRELS